MPQEMRLLDQNAGVEHLLNRLAKAKAANDGRLLFMDIYWLGCPGCRELLTRDKGTISQIEKETHALKVSWRTGSQTEESRRDPLTAAYIIFTQMVSGKKQGLDYLDPQGLLHRGRLIEDYATHERAHFPQLLFMDPASVQRIPLIQMCQAQKARKLFAINPYTNQPEFSASAVAASRSLLSNDAVYSQLLNENIFTTNNFDLNESVVLKSFSVAKEAHAWRLDGKPRYLTGVWSARSNHTQFQGQQRIATNVVPHVQPNITTPQSSAFQTSAIAMNGGFVSHNPVILQESNNPNIRIVHPRAGHGSFAQPLLEPILRRRTLLRPRAGFRQFR